MADKSFKEYLTESVKEYNYVLKLAVDEVTDRMKDILEVALDKYQLMSASDFKKTPIQESPLDFPNVKCSPVFISDIKMSYPGSRDFLETYIASSLGISEKCVVVYSENDPRQLETDLYLERSSEDYKANYKAILGSEQEGGPTEAEVNAMYGEGQVTGFLKELEDVRNQRETTAVVNPLSVAPKDDHASTLPDGYHDFDEHRPKNPESVIFGRARRAGMKD